jgi:hypothetical protein
MRTIGARSSILAATLAVADPGGSRRSRPDGGPRRRDGALTAGGRSATFFTHGPRTAKRTWKANAARTKADAHAVRAVEHEAHDER